MTSNNNKHPSPLSFLSPLGEPKDVHDVVSELASIGIDPIDLVYAACIEALAVGWDASSDNPDGPDRKKVRMSINMLVDLSQPRPARPWPQCTFHPGSPINKSEDKAEWLFKQERDS